MSSSNKKQAVLQLEKVTKSYSLAGGEYPVLKGIDLTVHRGDFLAVIGPSGSGKSTLMHIMGLLDVPSRGRVIINGSQANRLSDDQLAKLRNKEIGFVFQQFFLLSYLSAVDNVALPLIYAGVPLAERRRRAVELLKKVGLGHRLNHHPNQLSGGQQQRVAIARALVNKPAIILADEPTGNLDSTSGQQVLDLFIKLHTQGHTIVLVTHDLNVAKIAHKHIHLKDGKIIKVSYQRGK